MESVEAAAIGNELGTLFLEDLPDRSVGPFSMGMRLGPGDAFVHQPGVQLVIALDTQARREEALAHEADLVLDLTLLMSPTLACRRRARQDGASTSGGSGDCIAGPCRRRSSRPPSSCCRRRRARRHP